MKRKFTFLIAAALMLLTMMASTGTMWGQTKDNVTVSYGWEDADDATAWTITDAITKTSGQGNTGTYAGKINTNHTYVQFNEKVNVTSFSFAFKRTSTNSNYNVYIETSTDGNNWTAAATYAMNTFNNGSYSTKTKTFDGATAYYVRFHCYNTTAVRYVDDVSITYTTGGTPTCATPTFSPVAGTYTAAQSVTISTTTEGATIYYTTDGTDPTTDSNVYSSAINVGITTTIKAIAVKEGNNNSSIASATYTIVEIEHAGTEEDPYTVADARNAIDANTGLTDVYATGIVSEIVTEYSSQFNNISYNISSDGLTASDQLQIFRGACSGVDEVRVGDIVVVSGNLTKYGDTYEFAQGSTLSSLKLVAPTFYPEAGAVASGTALTISDLHSGATIYYTTDGTNPTTGSTPYDSENKPTITAATTFKAIAVKDNYTTSDVASAAYTLLAPAATPTFSPEAGTYTWAQNVTISTTTEGATIYYTTDGSNPTSSSSVYSEPIAVNETKTIKAIAAKDGMANSDVAEATYTMNIPAINAENVNLAYDATAGSIAYTMTNPVDGGVLTAAITGGNEGTWLTLGDVSGEAVALTCSANDGDADRSATVTLTYTYNTDKTVTKVVTVTQAHFVVDYATLPFNWDGGTKEDLLALTGVTGYGLGSNYAESNAPYRVKFDTDGDYILVKTNEQPGVVTVGIKKLGGANASSIIIKGSSNGEDFSTIQTFDNEGAANAVLEHETTISFDENDRYVMIYFNKPSGGSNVGVGPITIDQINNTPSITINPGPYNLNANGGDAELPVTYTNMPNDPQAEVWFCNAEGTETVSYNWITAEINAQNNVAGHIDANTGAARSAYFKVKGIDANDNAVYSDLVTINQAAYVLSIEFETASIDLAAGGESDRKLSFEYSGLGNDPEFSVNRYESDGTTPATYDWLTTEITDGNKVSITVSANTGAARTAYFKVYGSGSVASTESNLVTVNQAAQGANVTYTLATTIIPGRHYIIVGLDGDDAYAMGTQNTNNRAGVGITINGLIATVTSEQDVCEFVLSGDANNKYTIYDENKPGFLYAASSGNNYLKTETNLDANGNGLWSIVIDESATITAQGNYTRKLMRFNPNNGNPIFACYAVSNNPTGSAPHLYMKDNDTDPVYYSPTEITVNNPNTSTDPITVKNNEILELTGTVAATDPANLVIEDGGQLVFNNDNVQATMKKSTAHAGAKAVGDWYTIASPLAANVATDGVTHLTTGISGYDLYRYDEESSMWENIKAHGDFTQLEVGRGYLYWNADGVDIEFAGKLRNDDVTYNLTADGTGTYKGMNLIGNPFSQDITVSNITGATLTGGYVLSKAGAWSAEITEFKPCQGFLVQVNAAKNITISKSAAKSRANRNYIAFTVANSQYEDVTYAMFVEGLGLNKINHRNANIPMLYIAQNEENYAIATMSDETQSFNLNFKAMTTGQYTLSYKAEGNYDYLHVIDRLTGEDIDMLLDGEYSFIASPSDNDARFIVKLGYNTNNSAENDIFAFQNGSDIVVNGEGELQVFDVTGRMVATQHVNGVQTVNVPSQGVFIFKLNEKTQKIVVR